MSILHAPSLFVIRCLLENIKSLEQEAIVEVLSKQKKKLRKLNREGEVCFGFMRLKAGCKPFIKKSPCKRAARTRRRSGTKEEERRKSLSEVLVTISCFIYSERTRTSFGSAENI